MGLGEKIEVSRKEKRGRVLWGEVFGKILITRKFVTLRGDAEIQVFGLLEAFPNFWENASVEWVSLFGLECFFWCEDESGRCDCTTVAIKAAEALAKIIERGEFGEKGVEIEVGADFDCLGRDEDEWGNIWGGFASLELMIFFEGVDESVPIKRAEAAC